MTTKNEEVAQMFADGATEGGARNFFIEGNVIYSYGHHFPICVRLDDGSFIFNTDGYSQSTSRHKNMVKRACAIDSQSTRVVLMDTQQICDVVNAGIKTLSELTAQQLTPVTA